MSSVEKFLSYFLVSTVYTHSTYEVVTLILDPLKKNVVVLLSALTDETSMRTKSHGAELRDSYCSSFLTEKICEEGAKN